MDREFNIRLTGVVVYMLPKVNDPADKVLVGAIFIRFLI